MKARDIITEKWSRKYKSSINCSHPKGFSQKAHCAGKRKHDESIEMEMVCEDCGMCETHGDHSQQSLGEACWKGYHKEGMKTMFGKRYPNCVKNKNESLEIYIRKGECPACGDKMVAESQLNEKQDACYHKVKSRYKVWPSAYASGALVQCRKKGAANWGNKSNESITQEEYDQLDENLKKWFSDKWVRFGPDGKIKGDCARGDDSEGKPKCLPQSKAHSLGKKGRASAAARKRREDPNPERSGKAINVSTKKKSNEGVAEGKQPGQAVVDAILKVLPVAQEIWFHGSRATGKHRRNSDTDILVVVPDDLVGDQYLGVVRILQKLSSHFDNYDIQPTKAETNIHRIAQEEGKLLWSKQGVAEGITPNTIHKLADHKGVKWDNEPSFLRLTKRLTGKEHLDDLAQAELQQVKKHLEKQGMTEDLDESMILESQFDIIEEMIGDFAEFYGVDEDMIWEDIESVSDEELLDEAEAWQKKSGKNKNGGLNKKGVASYRASHPGSKLQTAVTTKPSKLKKGSKASKRRKSFCARMKGMKKSRTSAKTARDPNSRINKSLRKWHCESVELNDILRLSEISEQHEEKIDELQGYRSHPLYTQAQDIKKPQRKIRRIMPIEKIEAFVEKIEALGYKPEGIGSGYYGMVFQHPKRPKEVIKLFTANPGYLKWIDYCKKYSNRNPHLPKIRRAFMIDNKTGAVFMEKLNPSGESNKIFFLLGASPKVVMDTNHWLKDTNPTLYYTFKDMAEKFPRVEWDLHADNLMRRDDGTIVITDPISN